MSRMRRVITLAIVLLIVAGVLFMKYNRPAEKVVQDVPSSLPVLLDLSSPA